MTAAALLPERDGRPRGRRRRGPGPAGTALADVELEVAALVHATVGQAWPIVGVNAPPTPGWLARITHAVPPWTFEPSFEPSTDGRRLLLPARVDTGEGSAADLGLLGIMAVNQASRLRLRIAPLDDPPGTSPLARDLHWQAEGAALDAWLAREHPGLRPGIATSRRLARWHRPAPYTLGHTEEAVEDWVRRLLEGRVGAPPTGMPDLDAPTVARLEWAQALAAVLDQGDHYRGVAPVCHWGVPLPIER